MNRVKREWMRHLAAGFISNGVETPTEKVRRVNRRGPLVSVVKGLNAEFFRKEYDAGHVVQVKMENSQVVEALIYAK